MKLDLIMKIDQFFDMLRILSFRLLMLMIAFGNQFTIFASLMISTHLVIIWHFGMMHPPKFLGRKLIK